MYQPSASGSASNRSVSAVGAQSTTITSHRPERACRRSSRSARHLLGAGDHGHLLGGDRVHPGGVEHGEQVALDVGPRLLEPQLGVDLVDEQPVRDLGRLGDVHPRPRPGRDASYASARECAASVDSTSVRSPPAAASAAVPAATVDLPTPPLPVKRTMRTGELPRWLQGDQAPDSTRFLRPFNAVSIRIFSPLRLSMPMSGIETSRASR